MGRNLLTNCHQSREAADMDIDKRIHSQYTAGRIDKGVERGKVAPQERNNAREDEAGVEVNIVDASRFATRTDELKQKRGSKVQGAGERVCLVEKVGHGGTRSDMATSTHQGA
jgi:hypothetical protein